MVQIYFATTNVGKYHYLKNNLSDTDIELIQVPLEMPEPRSDSLQEIAREKVMYAYEHIQKPCVAIDAGFYVLSLNGFPGSFTNFALKTIGLEGILKLTEGKSRGAEFRNCLAYMDGSLKEPIYFESGVAGTLTESPRGTLGPYDWSALSLLFIPEGRDMTLAEMTLPEREAWNVQRRLVSFTKKFGDWAMQAQNLQAHNTMQ
jgi:XTP/dITP diphosphohydrolase